MDYFDREFYLITHNGQSFYQHKDYNKQFYKWKNKRKWRIIEWLKQVKRK